VDGFSQGERVYWEITWFLVSRITRARLLFEGTGTGNYQIAGVKMPASTKPRLQA
jgi:hypothetical protein